jgi:CheY-like chemotaxis protein
MSTRVLIIDDNQDLAESLAELLEIEGFEVDIAYSGAQTWDRLDTNHYDYCLTDIKLPDTNGLEIYNRAKMKIPEQNITAISGFRLEQIISSAFETEAVAVLNVDADENALGKSSNTPGAISLLISNNNRNCLDDECLQKQGIQDYHVLTHSLTENDINKLPNKAVYIFNFDEPAISALALAYEIHKTRAKARFIILLPKSTGLHGNPLQTYELTGILFKPFNMADFMELMTEDSQLSMTSSQG